MRIMTINMQQFQGDRARIAAFGENTDIILIQEAPGILKGLLYDGARWIARQTGHEYRSVSMHGGWLYGWRLAVLSRLPIDWHKEHLLDNPGPDGWRRSALGCQLRGDIRVITVHLSTKAGQLEEIGKVLNFLESMPGRGPAIIGGDFNVEPDHPAVRALLGAGFVDAWAAGSGSGATYKDKRIDYLFVRDFDPYLTKTVLKGASDHNGVLTFAVPQKALGAG